MALDVSVIVPVHNPGDYIERCIRSLVAQSLPAQRYEVIFVDDGSTDGTPRRLDQLAEDTSNIRVFHEPHSGWSGRPRNVGIDASQADYVFFCDHDDWLGAEALERMLATARRTDADIVVPKMVGNGRPAPRELFRANVDDANPWTTRLMTSLTPQKLLRRAFLDEHGIRFPEGKRRLEDQVFVVEAYLLAKHIAVLADYPCYHHLRRPDRGNAASQPIEPVGYYTNLREVIDVIEAHTSPGPERDLLLVRPFRNEILRRLGHRKFVRADPQRRELLVGEIRRLLEERFPPDFGDRFEAVWRMRATAARAGSTDVLLDLAGRVDRLAVRAQSTSLRWSDDSWRAHIEAEMVFDDGTPLCVHRVGDDLWAPDPRLVPDGIDTRPDTTEQVMSSAATACLVNRTTGEDCLVPDRFHTDMRIEGDVARLVFTADLRLDPATMAVGRPLGPGRWKLVVRLQCAGVVAETAVTIGPPSPAFPRPAILAGGLPVVPVHTRRGVLVLDIRPTARSLLDAVMARPVRAAAVRRGAITIKLDVDVGRGAAPYPVPVVVLSRRGRVATVAAQIVGDADGGLLRTAGNPRPTRKVRRLAAGHYSIGVRGDRRADEPLLLGSVRIGRRGRITSIDASPQRRRSVLPGPPRQTRVRRLRRRMGRRLRRLVGR